MSWGPISTAPLDGTPILAWCPNLYQGKGGCLILLWLLNKWNALPYGRDFEPTHWMVLPKNPLEVVC